MTRNQGAVPSPSEQVAIARHVIRYLVTLWSTGRRLWLLFCFSTSLEFRVAVFALRRCELVHMSYIYSTVH